MTDNFSSVKLILAKNGLPKRVFVGGTEIKGVRHVNFDVDATDRWHRVEIEMATDKLSIVQEEE